MSEFDALCFWFSPGPVLISADEFNLLYVAVTRAKRSLLMTPTLVNLMKRAGVILFYLKSKHV